jgi:EpsI family protein
LFRQKALWSFLFLIFTWAFYFSDTLVTVFAETEKPWITLSIWGIMLASLYLVFNQVTALRSNFVISSQVGQVLVFLLVSGYIVGRVFTLPTVQTVSVILMVPGLVLAIFGPFVCQTLISPLLYFLLIILLQDNYLINPELIVSLAAILFFLLLKNQKAQKLKNAVDLASLERPLWVYQNARWLVPTAIIFGFFMTGPWLGDNIRHFYPPTERVVVLRAPLGSHGWLGPSAVKSKIWMPVFPTASATLQTQYLPPENILYNDVYLYSAYFNSDRTAAELFESSNTIYDASFWKKVSSETREVDAANGKTATILEVVLTTPTTARVVWYWYYVAGIVTNDPLLVNMLDTVRVVSKEASGSGVVVLSSAYESSPEEARGCLSSFVKAMYGSLEVLRRPEIDYVRRTHRGK